MKPISHVAVSAVTSVVFGYVTQSWTATLACFISGILFDLDHVLDYIIHKKRIPFRLSELEAFCSEEKGGKLYLIFHCYELMILYWLLVVIFGAGVFWIGIGIGITIHFIADEIVNPLRPLSYWFVYRIKHRFDKKGIFKKDLYDTLK